jgi:hypothetical protein
MHYVHKAGGWGTCGARALGLQITLLIVLAKARTYPIYEDRSLLFVNNELVNMIR